MRIVFMGTPQVAVPSLVRLADEGHEIVAVYTQPDRPSGRGNKIVFLPVKQVALDRGFALYQPEKVKTDETREMFVSHAADIAVVVAYGRILPEPFLRAYPHGAINVHFSLLPKYRGAAPVNWAIANGEAETGVTTMKMDAGLDMGDILLQRSTAIGASETAPELMTRLADDGADLIVETLRNLDDIEPRPQDHAAATLAPIMRRENGLIDWTMSASEIANRVRGFQPFPSAHTTLGGAGLKIWSASPSEVSADDRPIGEIVEVGGDSLMVACGGGVLAVEGVQPEGKRRMSVRDFLNGTKVEVGAVLGEE